MSATKRPRPQASSSSPNSAETQRKRYKKERFITDKASTIRIYIIPSKVDSATLWELTSALENSRILPDAEGIRLYELISATDAQDADIIITSVHMKKRLERHIDWDLAKRKVVLSPKWIQNSLNANTFLPYDGFYAVSNLQKPSDKPLKQTKTLLLEGDLLPNECETLVPPTVVKSQEDINHRQTYACLRNSPLECHNQKLIEELGILRQARELEGQDINALGYERAIGVIKSYPQPIDADTLASNIVKLPYIGEKILSKIIEFIEDGHIDESRAQASDQRFQSLSTFSSVYGIGPTTARKLYAHGLRNLNDLERYYDVYAGDEPDEDRKPGIIGNIPLLSIPVGIRLLKDLQQQISRDEVEEMYAMVVEELEHVRPGCACTVTGGYRRGKTRSNDVDIVITHADLHSEGSEMKDLCERLVIRLHKRGLVTHVMHMSSFHEPSALKTSHWDSMQKALTVFKLQDTTSLKRIHRRLDLIFAAPEVYWTAVTGWTGSKLFERDLRRWAKDHGLKFDSSGITRRRDSGLYFPRTEREVFHMLGLPWIEPAMRNADA